MAQVLNAPPSLLPSATYAGKAGNPSPGNLWLPAIIPNPLASLTVVDNLTAQAITDNGTLTAHSLTCSAPLGFAAFGLGVPAGSTIIDGTLVVVNGTLQTNSTDLGHGLTSPAGFPANCPKGWITGTLGGASGNNTFSYPPQAGMGSISSPIALTNGQVFQVAGNKCVVSVPAGGSAVVVPDARLQATGAGADWQGIPYAVSYDLNVVPTTVIDYTGGTGVATQTGKVLLTNTGGGVARFGVFWF